MPAGRPKIVESPEEMDAIVDAYLDGCLAKEKPVTLTGMILALGLSSRQAFDNYQNRPEFFDSVKRAKLLVENAYECALHGTSVTGSIFALKNMGWSDKIEQEVSGKNGDAIRTITDIRIVGVRPDGNSGS